MRRLFALCLWALLGTGALTMPAAAHPHIFINATATVIFDVSGAVTGIRHAWTFDEAFSAWSIHGLDANNDGAVSQDEMQDLADEDMIGLAAYDYYTFAGEGPGNLTFTNGRNQTLNHVDGLTTLRFEIDLERPYHIKDTLELAINDPEYYVAITFADASAVTLENAPAGCAVSLEPHREMPPEIADQLYALPPDVTQLPPDLAAALRGVQGAILIKCPPTAAAPSTALEAVTEVGEAKPALPFGGPPAEPGFAMPRTGVLGWIGDQQRQFYQALTEALGRLKTDNTAFLVLGGLSFLYGIFHAAGPGHGKVVISSYMLANERQVRRGVILSFAAALLQSLVAVIFVLIVASALNLTSAAMGDAANWVGVASYALVALLGLWLIARKLFGWGHSHGATRNTAAKAHAHLHDGEPSDVRDAHGRAAGDPHFGHDHGHDDHAHGGHEHLHVVPADRLNGDWREQLGVVLAVGLRPCSGALVVLVFALSQDLLPAGIAAVFLMGLGTAITVAVFATLAVGAKGFARRLAGAESRAATVIIWWAELLGAVIVFGFGVVLLLASL